MHFDARRVAIPDGAVREAIQLEVCVQLGVDAQKEILVERRGQAQWIVIREQQFTFRLDEIRAEQQVIARLKGGAYQAEEGGRARRVEVPDIRAEECHERRMRISAGSASSPSS